METRIRLGTAILGFVSAYFCRQAFGQGVNVSLELSSPSSTEIDVVWHTIGEEPEHKFMIKVTCLSLCTDPCESRNLNNSDSPVRIRGLEEFTAYSVVVVVLNSGHSEVARNSGVITSLPAAPSDHPEQFHSVNTTASSSTLLWRAVPCQHRNSNITHYTLRYVRVNDDPVASMTVQTVDGGGKEEEGRYTLTDLLSSTNYSVEIAAVSQEGKEGIFSSPIFVVTAPCKCRNEGNLSRRDVTLISVLSTFAGTVLLHTALLLVVIAALRWRGCRPKTVSEVTTTSDVKEQYSSITPKKWRRDRPDVLPEGTGGAPRNLESELVTPTDPEEFYANFGQILEHRASIASNLHRQQ